MSTRWSGLSTAFHEVGHVAVCLSLGVPVFKVDIKTNGDSRGATYSLFGDEVDVVDQVTIFLAGGLCDHARLHGFTTTNIDFSCLRGTDKVEVEKLVRTLHADDPLEQGELFHTGVIVANDILRRHWYTITETARLLCDRGELSGGELRQLLRI